jgi:hypothetical protein
MTFAEFYHNSTGWNGSDFSGPVKLIPACGSDSIAYIDARLSTPNAVKIARKIAKQRRFPAFKVLRGRSIRQSECREVTRLLMTEETQ